AERAVIGAGLGLLLARLGTPLLAPNLPPLAQSLSDRIVLRPSGAILACTLIVTLLAVLAFGVWPAVRATRADIMTPLKNGARGASSRLLVDRALVVGQVALALVLVSWAASFVPS